MNLLIDLADMIFSQFISDYAGYYTACFYLFNITHNFITFFLSLEHRFDPIYPHVF